MKTDKPFIPQITNVEILDYPILAGSGNIGIKADVLGEKKMKAIGLIEENYWRQTPAENKQMAAVGIAARTFRLDLLRHFNMDHKKVQTAAELMYHHWDSTGRKEEGYRTEMLVNDEKFLPNNEETEIEFDIHDGFAQSLFGTENGDGVVVTFGHFLPVDTGDDRHFFGDEFFRNGENFAVLVVELDGDIAGDFEVLYNVSRITLAYHDIRHHDSLDQMR